MSGDVQPRKRKDKKRKKEDSTEQIPSQPQTPLITTTTTTPSQSEDVNIHVHKEDGTGGGICAKIIFFLLFSALAVLIGLIITEHRGLTDLDTADQESRFSQIFEGWIDNNVNHEDDHDEHIASSLEDDDHDEHEENESPESHQDEQEEEEEEEEEEEVSEADEEDVSEAEEDEVSEAEDEETSQAENEEEEDEDTAEEDEALESEEQELDNEDESEGKDEISEEKDEDEEEEEEEVASKEAEKSVEEDEEDEEDEDEAIKEGESEEEKQSQEKESEEVNEEDEEDEDKEKLEKEDEEAEEEESEDKKVDGDNQEDEEADDANNSKVVVKIGVGVALLVVAHVVLVKKWKSASLSTETPAKEEPPPLDLSRRNTIVVPPTYQEIEQDIEDNAEEEYSDEDGEVESDDDRIEPKSTELKYQELRTTYTRSLTPESEAEYQTKPTDEDEEYEDEEDEEEEVEEEEEEESDAGEYEKEEDEDDDEDLLKRLEAKYGKLRDGQQKGEKQEDFDEQFSSWKRVNVRHDNEPEESDSEKQSDDDDVGTYEYENITNKDDLQIKEKIDEAQKNIQNNAAYAIKLFDVLLQNNPSSPRSLYGKAQALNLLADQRRSNEILQKAIAIYFQILDLNVDVPDALFEAVAEKCINNLRFMGNYNRAIDVHNKLITRFPHNPKYQNQLVVTYLTINRVNKARITLQQVLSKYPNDGFALVHYGFILKTADNNLNAAVSYLKKGIATKEPGVIDGRFYFHLGDALARLGKTEEAMKVYEEGVEYGLFLSKYQRSLYNVDRLKGKPWWEKKETPYSNLYTTLESNWEKIRDEGLSVLKKNGLFQNESENLKNTGDWKQFELFARGQKNQENCKKCPFTCKIIESIPDARGCRRGQTKFSVMHPGTHVWPHCGPTNCRLRVHLGLHVPEHTYIRVANEQRSWKNGKVFIFDDSFEHEVWHNGTTLRLVLIVDVWHPQLTAAEKRSLSPI